MKLILLSDIHSYPLAFQKAVDAYPGSDVKFCILGDTINYGPDPVKTIRILRNLAEADRLLKDDQGRIAVLMGNHEEAWLWCQIELVNKFDKILNSPDPSELITYALPDLERGYQRDHPEIMAPHALKSLLLNMISMCSNDQYREDVEWYRQLMDSVGKRPMKFNINGWNLNIAHSDMENIIYNRILYPCDFKIIDRYVRRILVDQKTTDHSILLHGHTHLPTYHEYQRTTSDRVIYDQAIQTDASVVVINPGSLGQPRDRDIRPAMTILEFGNDPTEFTTTFTRLTMDPEEIKQHLEALKMAGFPERVLAIAEQAPLPGEVEMKCGIEFFRKRAGNYFIKGTDDDE